MKWLAVAFVTSLAVHALLLLWIPPFKPLPLVKVRVQKPVAISLAALSPKMRSPAKPAKPRLMPRLSTPKPSFSLSHLRPVSPNPPIIPPPPEAIRRTLPISKAKPAVNPIRQLSLAALTLPKFPPQKAYPKPPPVLKPPPAAKPVPTIPPTATDSHSGPKQPMTPETDLNAHASETVQIDAPSSDIKTSARKDTPLVKAMPLYRLNPDPLYPLWARSRGYQGQVTLAVLVGKDGRVLDLKIDQSSGFRILDRAAAKAVRTWRFEPAKSGSKAIAMWVEVPIRFQLK